MSRVIKNNGFVLVTGGAGYIGSHVCKALVRAGYFPIVIDDLSQGHKWALGSGEFYHGNILDIKFLYGVFLKYKPIAVIHFAAKSIVSESIKAPLVYYRNNVEGTLKLLRMVKIFKPRCILFSSTAAVYGEGHSGPISESCATNPINPYGYTKLKAEKLLIRICNSSKINFIIFRFFNVAGADIEGNIGELHTPETHLIPNILNLESSLKRGFVIYGSDYPTADGTCVRDYIHVNDLASAHIKALGYLLSGGRSCVLNLGTQRSYSVLEVLKAAENVTGKKIQYLFGERRPNEPAVLVADSQKAYDVLNWEAKHSDIDFILQTASKWHKSDIYKDTKNFACK